MADIKLKPCPFCGGEVSLMYNSLGIYTFYHGYGYDDCPFQDIVLEDDDISTLGEAADAWNRRAYNDD